MIKTWRFFNDRRAVSPVLSSLLLIVVAVGAMALATTATYVITTNLKDIMSERFTMEDVWFDNSTGNISVYLRNIGEVTFSVSAVYVNHVNYSFTSPYSLEKGKHSWLNISSSWNSGGVYHVEIVTTRGTHLGDDYTAP